MKKCSKCKETKSVECFSKKKVSKDGLRSQCKSCDSVYDTKRYRGDREYHKIKNSKWYQENKDDPEFKKKNRSKSAKWSIENPERKKDTGKQYYINNQDKFREYRKEHNKRIRQYNREYRKNNRGRCNALNSKRYLRKLNATPKWLTPLHHYWLLLIYENCPIGYEVDHIIPIQGKNLNGREVRGLHVPWNLQYLTKTENLRKKNRFNPLSLSS